MFSKLKLFVGVTACAALAAVVLAAPAFASLKVTTEAATEVKATSAVLHATVETGGVETLAGFEIGTTKESGEGPGGELIKAGTYAPVHLSKKVTGLQPQTTYYFRVGARGGGGSALGSYLTFTTPKLMGLYVDQTEKKFKALTYPAIVTGSLVKPFKIVFAEAEASCTGGSFPALSALSGPAASITLYPELSSCELLGEQATVNPAACGFSLSPNNPPFGSVGISCLVKEPLEIVTSHCTVWVAEQAAVANALAYETSEAVEGAQVTAGVNRTVSYTKSGPYCFLVTGTARLTFTTTLTQTS